MRGTSPHASARPGAWRRDETLSRALALGLGRAPLADGPLGRPARDPVHFRGHGPTPARARPTVRAGGRLARPGGHRPARARSAEQPAGSPSVSSSTSFQRMSERSSGQRGTRVMRSGSRSPPSEGSSGTFLLGTRRRADRPRPRRRGKCGRAGEPARRQPRRAAWWSTGPSSTATVVLRDGRRIDVATARRESYRAPGALPDVEPASLAEDLARRDFSVNALAVRLDRAAWGRVLDTTGGLVDLRARRIRVLHALSFVEDPTRILRAARFAARLDWRVDRTTRRLAAHAATLERLSRPLGRPSARGAGAHARGAPPGRRHAPGRPAGRVGARRPRCLAGPEDADISSPQRSRRDPSEGSAPTRRSPLPCSP